MADHSDRPGYSFDQSEPREVSRYFRNKAIRPSFSWLDVEPEEHAISFTVAKAMKLDVLSAIRAEVQNAIDNGITLREFQKNLEPRLKKMGWWGERDMKDPLTGETLPARLGSPRRLRTIYRTNLRMARSAGQWERIQRTKNALPYLLYLLGPSERHRPDHAAKEGMVLPVDDQFWDHWMPPNGWGCKCHVRQITAREAETRGVSETPDVEERAYTNPRTGEVTLIPRGIDKGWERNPGRLRQRHLERFLSGELDNAPVDLAKVAARDMASSWRFARVRDGDAIGSVPIAMMPSALASRLGSKTRTVLFSDQTAAKQILHHPELTEEDYLRLADLVWEGKVVVRGDNHLGFLSRDDDLPWIAIVKTTQDKSELYLQTLFKVSSARYVRRWLNDREVLRD